MYGRSTREMARLRNAAEAPIMPVLSSSACAAPLGLGRQMADPTRRRERRLTLNYAKAVIEKTASYTMSGLSFVVDPEDGSAEAAARARRAERALREIQEANNLEQLEFDNEIDCSVLGDAAYKVTWDGAEKRVLVTAPDVQGLFVWPWGDDSSRLWRVASGYALGR